MNNLKVSLTLIWNEHSKTYTIQKVINSINYKPGDELKESGVKQLIKLNIKVTVVRRKDK